VLPGVGVPHESVSKSIMPLVSMISCRLTHFTGTFQATRLDGWALCRDNHAWVIPSAVDIGGGSLLLKGANQRPLSIGSISQFQFKVKGGSASKGTPELAAYTDIMAIPRGDRRLQT